MARTTAAIKLLLVSLPLALSLPKVLPPFQLANATTEILASPTGESQPFPPDILVDPIFSDIVVAPSPTDIVEDPIPIETIPTWELPPLSEPTVTIPLDPIFVDPFFPIDPSLPTDDPSETPSVSVQTFLQIVQPLLDLISELSTEDDAIVQTKPSPLPVSSLAGRFAVPLPLNNILSNLLGGIEKRENVAVPSSREELHALVIRLLKAAVAALRKDSTLEKDGQKKQSVHEAAAIFKKRTAVGAPVDTATLLTLLQRYLQAALTIAAYIPAEHVVPVDTLTPPFPVNSSIPTNATIVKRHTAADPIDNATLLTLLQRYLQAALTIAAYIPAQNTVPITPPFPTNSSIPVNGTIEKRYTAAGPIDSATLLTLLQRYLQAALTIAAYIPTGDAAPVETAVPQLPLASVAPVAPPFPANFSASAIPEASPSAVSAVPPLPIFSNIVTDPSPLDIGIGGLPLGHLPDELSSEPISGTGGLPTSLIPTGEATLDVPTSDTEPQWQVKKRSEDGIARSDNVEAIARLAQKAFRHDVLQLPTAPDFHILDVVNDTIPVINATSPYSEAAQLALINQFIGVILQLFGLSELPPNPDNSKRSIADQPLFTFNSRSDLEVGSTSSFLDVMSNVISAQLRAEGVSDSTENKRDASPSTDALFKFYTSLASGEASTETVGTFTNTLRAYFRDLDAPAQAALLDSLQTESVRHELTKRQGRGRPGRHNPYDDGLDPLRLDWNGKKFIMYYTLEFHQYFPVLNQLNPTIAQGLSDIFTNPNIPVPPLESLRMDNLPDELRRFVIDTYVFLQIIQEASISPADKLQIFAGLFAGVRVAPGFPGGANGTAIDPASTNTTTGVPPIVISPGGLPPVVVPPGGVPPIGVPPITIPPIGLPPITVPPIGVPPVTLPPVTLPPVTLPPVTVPPVTLPPINLLNPNNPIIPLDPSIFDPVGPANPPIPLDPNPAGPNTPNFPPPAQPTTAKRSMRRGLRIRQFDEGSKLDDADKLGPAALHAILGPAGSLDPMGQYNAQPPTQYAPTNTGYRPQAPENYDVTPEYDQASPYEADYSSPEYEPEYSGPTYPPNDDIPGLQYGGPYNPTHGKHRIPQYLKDIIADIWGVDDSNYYAHDDKPAVKYCDRPVEYYRGEPEIHWGEV